MLNEVWRLVDSKVRLLSLIILTFSCGMAFHGNTQPVFSKDSLIIAQNSNRLIQNPNAPSTKDSLILYLTKGVKHPSAATKDLTNYHLARYYFVHREIKKVEEIVKQALLDTFNLNYSDAKFYNMEGVILSLKKEYSAAISTFLTASTAYRRQGNIIREHTVYNNIANIFLAMGDHEQAYKYSAKCFSAFRDQPGAPNYLSILGVLAVCENNVDRLDSAEAHINLGMKNIEKSKDVKGKILMNYAQSELDFQKGDYYKAIPFSKKSLALSKQYHLLQYMVMSDILLMKIHNQLKEYKLALSFGEEANQYMNKGLNISFQHAITNGMAISYAGLNQYKKAFYYFKKTDSLKTIDRNLQNKRVMDSLTVRFESLKDKNKILKQTSIIATNKKRMERSRVHLAVAIFIIVIVCLIIIVVIILYRLRLKITRQQNRVKLGKATTAAEEKYRDKVASQLHDGLAAELTALRLELEVNNSASEKASQMLSNAHQITRNISHNLSPFTLKNRGLVGALRYVVENYSTANNNIHFYSNVSDKLPLGDEEKILLYRSTQELIQNALKHANAQQIIVQVNRHGNELTITVEDDGVGIPDSALNDSIGLGSLKDRIELMKGKIAFESSPDRGTTVYIDINLKMA